MAFIDADSAPMTSFSGAGKLTEISGIYLDILLNWIDFQSEIGEHCRLVVAEKNGDAKYLNTLYFFGKRS